MEGHEYKMTILVREINRVNEENQKLKTMLKRMNTSYNELQKHIRSLLRVDRIQISNPDDPSEDNFDSKILSPKSLHVDSGGAVSHQSYHSSDCHERVQEKKGKNAKFMEDRQLPSKKRKINYVQLDNDIICDELPNKKHKALSKCFSEQMAAAPKRIVSVRTRSVASVITDGCRWRKYGQKTTRKNPHSRSYYKCAMAPSCPVKKQVQRCAEDPTIVVTSYEGEHTHSLSPLAMAVMDAGLSNQLICEGLNRENFLEDTHFIPFSTARISTSGPFPTITLDLTQNLPNPELQVKQPNPGLHLQPSDLAAGSFQDLNQLPNNLGHAFDHSSIMDSVASIKVDPSFTAALAVAIAGSMLNLGSPIQGTPGYLPATQYTNG